MQPPLEFLASTKRERVEIQVTFTESASMTHSSAWVHGGV